MQYTWDLREIKLGTHAYVNLHAAMFRKGYI